MNLSRVKSVTKEKTWYTNRNIFIPMKSYFAILLGTLLTVSTTVLGQGAGGTVWYSNHDGDWNNHMCWTTNAAGTVHVNPENKIPGENDKVVILGGRTIRLSHSATVHDLELKGSLIMSEYDGAASEENKVKITIKGGYVTGTSDGILHLYQMDNVVLRDRDGNLMNYEVGDTEEQKEEKKTYSTAHNTLFKVCTMQVWGGEEKRDISAVEEFGNLDIYGKQVLAMSNFTVHGNLTIHNGAKFSMGTVYEGFSVTVEGDIKVDAGGILTATEWLRGNRRSAANVTERSFSTFYVQGNFINDGGNVIMAKVGHNYTYRGETDENKAPENTNDYYKKSDNNTTTTLLKTVKKEGLGTRNYYDYKGSTQAEKDEYELRTYYKSYQPFVESYGDGNQKQNSTVEVVFYGKNDSRFYAGGPTDVYRIVCDKEDNRIVDIEASAMSRESFNDGYDLSALKDREPGNVYHYYKVSELIADTRYVPDLLRVWSKTVNLDSSIVELPWVLKKGVLKLGNNVRITRMGENREASGNLVGGLELRPFPSYGANKTNGLLDYLESSNVNENKISVKNLLTNGYMTRYYYELLRDASVYIPRGATLWIAGAEIDLKETKTTSNPIYTAYPSICVNGELRISAGKLSLPDQSVGIYAPIRDHYCGANANYSQTPARITIEGGELHTSRIMAQNGRKLVYKQTGGDVYFDRKCNGSGEITSGSFSTGSSWPQNNPKSLREHNGTYYRDVEWDGATQQWVRKSFDDIKYYWENNRGCKFDMKFGGEFILAGGNLYMGTDQTRLTKDYTDYNGNRTLVKDATSNIYNSLPNLMDIRVDGGADFTGGKLYIYGNFDNKLAQTVYAPDAKFGDVLFANLNTGSLMFMGDVPSLGMDEGDLIRGNNILRQTGVHGTEGTKYGIVNYYDPKYEGNTTHIAGNLELQGSAVLSNVEYLQVDGDLKFASTANKVIGHNLMTVERPDVDEVGNPVIDENGDPVMISEGVDARTTLVFGGAKDSEISSISTNAYLDGIIVRKSSKDNVVTLLPNAKFYIGGNGATDPCGHGLQCEHGKLEGKITLTAVNDGQPLMCGEGGDMSKLTVEIFPTKINNVQTKGRIDLSSDVHLDAIQYANNYGIVNLGKFNLKLERLLASNGSKIVASKSTSSDPEVYTTYINNGVITRCFMTDGTPGAGGLSLKLDKTPTYISVAYPMAARKSDGEIYFMPAYIKQAVKRDAGGVWPLELADGYFTVVPVLGEHPAVVSGEGASVSNTVGVYWKTKWDGEKTQPKGSLNNDLEKGYRCRLEFGLPSQVKSNIREATPGGPFKGFYTDLTSEEYTRFRDVFGNTALIENISDVTMNQQSNGRGCSYVYLNNKWYNQTQRKWWLAQNLDQTNAKNVEYRFQGSLSLNDANKDVMLRFSNVPYGYVRYEDKKYHTYPVDCGQKYIDVKAKGNDKIFPSDYVSDDYKDAFAVVLADADWTHGYNLDMWEATEFWSSGEGEEWFKNKSWKKKNEEGELIPADAIPNAQSIVHIQRGHTININQNGATCNQLDIEEGGRLEVGMNVKKTDIKQVTGGGTISYNAVYWPSIADSGLLKKADGTLSETSQFINNPTAKWEYSVHRDDVVFRLPEWISEYPSLTVTADADAENARIRLSDINSKKLVINGDLTIENIDRGFVMFSENEFREDDEDYEEDDEDDDDEEEPEELKCREVVVKGNVLLKGESSWITSELTEVVQTVEGNIIIGEDASSSAYFEKREGELRVKGDIICNSGEDIKLQGKLVMSGNGNQEVRAENIDLTGEACIEIDKQSAEKVIVSSLFTHNGAGEDAYPLSLSFKQGELDFDNGGCIYVKGVNDKYVAIPSGAGLSLNNINLTTMASDGTTPYSIRLGGILKLINSTLSTSGYGEGAITGGIGYLTANDTRLSMTNSTVNSAFLVPFNDEGNIKIDMDARSKINLGVAPDACNNIENEGATAANKANTPVLAILGNSELTAMKGSQINIKNETSDPERVYAVQLTSQNVAYESGVKGVAINLANGTKAGLYCTSPLSRLTVSDDTEAYVGVADIDIREELTINTGTSLDMRQYALDLYGDAVLKGQYKHDDNTTVFHGNNTVTFAPIIEGEQQKPLLFHNLTRVGDGLTVFNNESDENPCDIIVDGLFELEQGNVEVNTNAVECQGDVIVELGTEISGEGIKMAAGETTHSQMLKCEGTISKLCVNNPSGIDARTQQSNPIKISNKLILEEGVLSIASNNLHMKAGATIEPADGGAFSSTCMVATNMANTDRGITYELTSSDNGKSVVYPLGLDDKYTPAIVNIGTVTHDGTLRIEINDDFYPGLAQEHQNNALEYYWTLEEGEGLALSGTQLVCNTDESDANVESGNSLSDYVTAYLLRGQYVWRMETGTVETTEDDIKMTYPMSDIVSGNYLSCHSNCDLKVYKYISSTDGYAFADDGGSKSGVAKWQRYTYDEAGNSLKDGAEREYTKIDLTGAAIEINNNITVDDDSWRAQSMTLNPEGKLVLGKTMGHNFSSFEGTGTLSTCISTLPAATYNNFFKAGGGTMEYETDPDLDLSGADESSSYTVLASLTEVNNITFKGVGRRNWRSDLVTIDVWGDMKMAEDNAAEGQSLVIASSQKNNIRLHGDIYVGKGNMTGRGTYSFMGNATQNIYLAEGGVSGSAFKAWNMKIDNADGVVSDVDVHVGNSEYSNVGSTLTFVHGKLTMNNDKVCYVRDNQEGSIVGTNLNNYVIGKLNRNVGASGFLTFPIGDADSYAPMEVRAVKADDWTVAYKPMDAYPSDEVSGMVQVVSKDVWNVAAKTGNKAYFKLSPVEGHRFKPGYTPWDKKTSMVTVEGTATPENSWAEMSSTLSADKGILTSVLGYTGRDRNLTYGLLSGERFNIWKGITDDWSDAQNWTYGVPNLSMKVLLPSGCDYYPNITYRNKTIVVSTLRFEPGAKLVVQDGGRFFADNIEEASTSTPQIFITHYPDRMCTFVVSQPTSLLTFKVRVSRYLRTGRLYYVGNLANGSTTTKLGSTNLFVNLNAEGGDRITKYDFTKPLEEIYTTSNNSNLKGKDDRGTIGLIKERGTTPSVWIQEGTIQGPTISGGVEYNLSVANKNENPKLDGWQLLHNPLNAPVDIKKIKFGSYLNNSIYVRTFDSSSNSYKWITICNGVALNEEGGDASIEYLAPGQAFFVRKTDITKTSTVTLTLPTASNAPTSDVKLKSATLEKTQLPMALVKMRLSADGKVSSISDEAALAFQSGSVSATEKDAPKYFESETVYQIYVRKAGENEAIAALPGLTQFRDAIIPLGVQVPAGEKSATIKFTLNAIAENATYMLEDKVAGEMVDLSMCDYEYTFVPNGEGRIDDRFVLYVNSDYVAPEVVVDLENGKEDVVTGIEEVESDLVKETEDGIDIMVKVREVEIRISDDVYTSDAELRMYDIMGRVVEVKKGIAANMRLERKREGVMILEVKSGESVKRVKM